MYCLMLQNAVLELLQKSKIKIASLLPVEHRSHDDISKLMESKVKVITMFVPCHKVLLGWVLLQFFLSVQGQTFMHHLQVCVIHV